MAGSIHKQVLELAKKIGAPAVGSNVEETMKSINSYLDGTTHGANIADTVAEFKKVYSGGGPGPGPEPRLQEKTADPNVTAVEVFPDSGYDGLSKVTVTAAPLQNKTATPSTSAQTISCDENYYGIGEVAVGAVDSAIDQNILSSNIKKDVVILGVTGSYEGEQEAGYISEGKTFEALGNTYAGGEDEFPSKMFYNGAADSKPMLPTFGMHEGTIECRCTPTSAPTSSSYAKMIFDLVDSAGSSVGSRVSLGFILINGDTRLIFRTANKVNIDILEESAADLIGTAHTYSATISYADNTNTCKIYLDGEKVYETALPGLVLDGYTAARGTLFTSYDDTATWRMDHTTQRITMYNRALTAQEIAHNYSVDVPI